MELIKRNIHTDFIKCKAQMQMTLEDDVIISDSRPDAAKLIMDRGNVILKISFFLMVMAAISNDFFRNSSGYSLYKSTAVSSSRKEAWTVPAQGRE